MNKKYKRFNYYTMQNLESFEPDVQNTSTMSEYVSKNMYFVLLFLLGLGFLLYKFAFNGAYLEQIKAAAESNINIIDNIKQFLGKTWLGMNMEGDAIKVESEAPEGFLDRVMENVNSLHI
jgi:hypothetical protein